MTLRHLCITSLAAIGLVACGEQTPAADLATPAQTQAQAAPASASQSSAPPSWEATKERYRQVEVEPSDPVEALEYRGVLCEHYSGEFGGDGSQRDQELNAQMNKYKCGDELVAEARAMQASRSGEPDVVARLGAVIAIYGG